MFTWVAFINACLFVTLGSCLFSTINLFHLTLAAELCWVGLFGLAAVFGVFIDEAGCFSITFFILGFAAVELCFGLLTLLLMRHFQLSLFLPQNTTRVKAQVFAGLSKETLGKRKF